MVWFNSFTFELFHIGFQASSADCNLFTLHHDFFVVYLLLYIDDIIITGNGTSFIAHIVSRLGVAFDLKDLGPLKYFLGLQIEYTFQGLFVHQSKYALDLLPSSICWIASHVSPLVPPQCMLTLKSVLYL